MMRPIVPVGGEYFVRPKGNCLPRAGKFESRRDDDGLQQRIVNSENARAEM